MNSIFINLNENTKNKSVLVISNDLKLVETLKNKENKLTYNLSYFEYNKFNLVSSSLSLFDAVVFDNREDNCISKFAEIFKMNNFFDINIPVILLEKEVQDNINMYKNCNVFTLLYEPINIDILCSNVTLCLNYLYKNKRVIMEEGYYFDTYRELFFQNGRLINLTKRESSLMKLLIEKENQLVTYETIEDKVWKGKKFSKYTLRNIVKHIREKSDEFVIKNSSKSGYIVNTF